MIEPSSFDSTGGATRRDRARAEIAPVPYHDRADFRLGPWLVQPRLNRIAGEAGDVVLEPKAMQVLVRLAAEPGRAVTKDELHRAVLPAATVGDKVLPRAISMLRKALGD